MRKRIALLSLAALTLAGCGNLLQPAAAIVHDQKISIHEIEKALDEYEESDVFQRASEQGDPGALKRIFEQQELSERIEIAVLEPVAEDRDLEVSDEDVEEEIDGVKADFASAAAFEEALKEEGYSVSDFRDLVFLRLLQNRVKNYVTEDLTPSDEELRAFYDDNAQRYIETDLSHIVLSARNDAVGISRTLNRLPEAEREQQFAETARQESINSETAVAGGDLGYAAPGQIDPALEATAAGLPIGEVSEPVRTSSGFEIILVKDRRPIPFEDVRVEIIEALAGEERDEAWEKWLAEAYEDADIEVNPRYGELDPQTHQVVDPPANDAPGTIDVSPTETPFEPPAG